MRTSTAPMRAASSVDKEQASEAVSPGRGLAGQLLDPPLRLQQQRLRNRQPERLGSLEVDHQLELRGLLDGEVSRFGPFQDLVDMACGFSKKIRRVRSVAHQAASRDEAPIPLHCGEAMLECQCSDLSLPVPRAQQWVWEDQ